MTHLICLFFLVFPIVAFAETVQISGPEGPLEGEMIAVDDASHVVVIVPAVGQIDRDGNVPGLRLRTNSYKLLAEGLAEQGVASVRIDTRGSFGSATAIANPKTVTIAEHAKDASDWVVRAAELAPCVWIAGHFEGGLLALVTASDPPDALCGLILLNTPGRRAGRLMIERSEGMLTEAEMAELQALVTDLENAKTPEASELSTTLRAMTEAFLRSDIVDCFSYDPAVVAQNWGGPALVVQASSGPLDGTIDADILENALTQSTRLNLAGATVMLKSDVPGNPAAVLKDPSLPLHPELLPGIIQFLNQH